MRPIICDVCGKMMKIETAFDEDGHTTDDGYVNVQIIDSRDYGDEFDICIDCYNKILEYANNLKPQKETSFKEYLDEQMEDPEFKKEYDKLEKVFEKECDKLKKKSEKKIFINVGFRNALRDAIYRKGDVACNISKTLGLPANCLTNIIMGHTKKIAYGRLCWICNALNITEEDIING